MGQTKCVVIKTRKRMNWCKTHNREQFYCLMDALGPFAEFIRIYEGSDARNGSIEHRKLSDNHVIYSHSSRAGEAIITVGMLRAAREAMEVGDRVDPESDIF